MKSRLMITALLVVLLAASSAVATNRNVTTTHDLQIVGIDPNKVILPEPEMFTRWSRQYTPGAGSKSVWQIKGSSNTQITVFEIQTTGNPRRFSGILLLDTDMDQNTGFSPRFDNNEPFDLGVDFTIYIDPTRAWVERSRDRVNVGIAPVTYTAQSLTVTVSNEIVGATGNGNMNFGLVVNDQEAEFIPSAQEYDAWSYGEKTRSLHLHSTGLVTITPGSGVLLRHGDISRLSNPTNEVSLGDFSVILETFRPFAVYDVRYILDGEDQTSAFRKLAVREGRLANTNDFTRYSIAVHGRSWTQTYPDSLFPGWHTLTVVVWTDQGVFTDSVRWFIQTTYEKGDLK